MPAIELIEHRGRLAAIVVGDQAIISDRLAPKDRRVVQTRCVEALEKSQSRDGNPGPGLEER